VPVVVFEDAPIMMNWLRDNAFLGTWLALPANHQRSQLQAIRAYFHTSKVGLRVQSVNLTAAVFAMIPVRKPETELP